MDYGNIQFWPQSLKQFGQNPYGEALFRVLWAPSRKAFRDVDLGLYQRDVGERWVMEKWLSAAEFSGGLTREQWQQNQHLSWLPYPERGEYVLCHVFEFAQPGDCNLGGMIEYLQAGKKINPNENLVAIKEAVAKEEQDASSRRQAIIRNALPAFGVNPMVGYGGARGTKAGQLLRSAQELKMPQRGGETRVRKGKTYHIPVQI